jgi:hypothetical protein
MCPFITFYCIDAITQETEKLAISQMLFFENSTTSVPYLLDDIIDGDEELFDFRRILGVTARKEVGEAWAAFRIFRDWLESGRYTNDEIEASHLQVYILAEQLQSSNFANAIMKDVLRAIPAAKYDATLGEDLELVFKNTTETSLIRTLYFDAVYFWYIYPGGRLYGEHWSSGGDIIYKCSKELYASLRSHRRETCRCDFRKERSELDLYEGTLSAADGTVGTLRMDVLRSDACHQEPWLDQPERFFTEHWRSVEGHMWHEETRKQS